MVSEDLAYGYAATSSGDICGRCYQLDFTSGRVSGKTMIVQALNIGYDVAGHQFDLLIPGGGVGAYNACGIQWGVSNGDLGAQYGGFLTACQQQYGYNDVPVLRTCVADRCTSVFGSRGLTELEAGCNWFVTWFDVADNPTLSYKEVSCPSELTSRSGMNRVPLNDVNHSCD
jgi:hypothetical protein